MQRVTPFALLSILVLGSALGIGLGLAQAPTSGPSVPSVAARPLAAPVRRSTPVTPTTSIPVAVSVPPCTSQSLQLSSSALNTATPTKLTQGAITLLNVSGVACELATIPVFEVLGSAGTVVVSSMPGKVVNDLIKPGQAQAANISWENWCGTDIRPLSLSVVLPNGGGTLSIAFGNQGTLLPTCLDHSQPSALFAHGSGGTGTRFGG
jgi:hypothetical protein